MRRRTGRRPGPRLLLILAALASLVGGYYLGQYWQRKPLAGLSAVLYPQGAPIDYPDGLAIADPAGEDAPWRLFVAVDTFEPACQEYLNRFGFVINRLAAWPTIQSRLRLSLLAYDGPDEVAAAAFTRGANWAEVIGAPPGELDRLAGQLGILPARDDWCAPAQANGILVSPDATAWALIPYEQPAIMARNIGTIIRFVE